MGPEPSDPAVDAAFAAGDYDRLIELLTEELLKP
jgi:hypothetical protein